MTTLSLMLSEKGFTCLQIDLALPDPHIRSNSSSLMEWFEDGSSRSSIDMDFGKCVLLSSSHRSSLCNPSEYDIFSSSCVCPLSWLPHCSNIYFF